MQKLAHGIFLFLAFVCVVETKECFYPFQGKACEKQCCGNSDLQCLDSCENVTCSSDDDCGTSRCKNGRCGPEVSSNTAIIAAVSAAVACCIFALVIIVIIKLFACCRSQPSHRMILFVNQTV